MTWYLQSDGIRQMIDDHIHPGFWKIDSCTADTWKQAKALLVGE